MPARCTNAKCHRSVGCPFKVLPIRKLVEYICQIGSLQRVKTGGLRGFIVYLLQLFEKEKTASFYISLAHSELILPSTAEIMLHLNSDSAHWLLQALKLGNTYNLEKQDDRVLVVLGAINILKHIKNALTLSQGMCERGSILCK